MQCNKADARQKERKGEGGGSELRWDYKEKRDRIARGEKAEERKRGKAGTQPVPGISMGIVLPVSRYFVAPP